MNYLTRQEQKVLGTIILLLLVGWAVQIYWRAHPPETGPKAAGTAATTMVEQAQP
ncbi:MAG TPA: hypothetical protein VL527_02635 [Dongiaceae bacterium]|nr:hypothetical protein [Dongiaceae bacterium]